MNTMKDLTSRRVMLKSGLMIAGGVILGHQAQATDHNKHEQQDRPAPLPPDLVKEFVTVGHGNLKRTTELLDQQPTLLNATWDWGGGDFESAIEGAGHVGNKEVAEFLLSRGARMNVFCAAMLGRLEIVKSILTAYPNLKTSKGPHGLMLLHHAQKGGDAAKPVLEYLTSIGAS
jgi:hypothetical protein